MAKKLIQNMHMQKGALTKKATKAGETPMQFAAQHKGDSGKTGDQARLAEELAGFRKKK